jgi:hypothetical protein
MALAPRQQHLLEIETARMRHAWAKAQIERGQATPALLKYLKDSLQELAVLRDESERILARA